MILRSFTYSIPSSSDMSGSMTGALTDARLEGSFGSEEQQEERHAVGLDVLSVRNDSTGVVFFIRSGI